MNHANEGTKERKAKTVVLEGNGQRPSHHGDGYREADIMYTLNTTEVHAVACKNTIDATTIEDWGEERLGHSEETMAMRPGTHGEVGENITPPLAARDYKDPIFFACEKKETWCMTTGSFTGFGYNQTPTLMARDYKDPTVVAYEKEEQQMSENKMKYIVRRLTPTECARLQGFPDRWGDIDEYETLDDDQYQFWLDVRKTFDGINGRESKEYTREQIRKWHNGLHTDSSEYKMWGNGIALPCFEFVMQGIQETKEYGD